jgi:membrane protease YdiL (CAAX protease family)
VVNAAGLTIRPVSGAIWVVLMFLVAFTFAAIRKRSASLFPAIASHAAFNAAMNFAIFAWLWKFK